MALLRRYGAPVVYPAEQTCCGQPAFNSGYWEEARRVIRHFCDVFQSHRWIVCPSGSCTAMCRVFFGHADPDPRIVAIGRRVFEFTEFLHDILGVSTRGLPSRTRSLCTSAATDDGNWAWSSRR